jgi:hypothetical protein
MPIRPSWRERLAESHPEWRLHALGGRRLGGVVRRTGGTWIGDTTNCSAIGLCSVVLIYFRARWLSFKMRRFVRRDPVDVVVLCDWGGFNCRQLKFFTGQRTPILYYFPPRSWQRSGAAGLQFATMATRGCDAISVVRREITIRGMSSRLGGSSPVGIPPGSCRIVTSSGVNSVFSPEKNWWPFCLAPEFQKSMS